MSPPPPSSTLFPYTTLFRSVAVLERLGLRAEVGGQVLRVVRYHGFGLTAAAPLARAGASALAQDRKSTRLNSSHMSISYAVFCLKKKKKQTKNHRLSHKECT